MAEYISTYQLPNLPLGIDLDTVPILKTAIISNTLLAEFKGLSESIPNSMILLNTLVLQEAKESSAIENIFTTHDLLYQALEPSAEMNPQVKEVINYAEAMNKGFKLMNQKSGISINDIITIQGIIEGNSAGLRKQAGTVLRNGATGEVVYTPPQEVEQIVEFMQTLEKYLNEENSTEQSLVKMAIIHHYFESIHPFYDGNGRTGRIICILYLVMKGLITQPILYMSRYIAHHKSEYYRLLQLVRDTNQWEEWIIFMMKAVENAARHGIVILKEIKTSMMMTKKLIKTNHPNIYSQDLINYMYRFPYIRVESLAKEIGKTRQTTTIYLQKLEELGLVSKLKKGNITFYVHTGLFNILSSI